MEQAMVVVDTLNDSIEKDMIDMVNSHSDRMHKVNAIEKVKSENIRLANKIKRVEEKKKAKRKFIKNLLVNFVMFACLLFLVWVFASWVNVAVNNMSPETIKNIWSWNFFKVFF